MKKRIIPLVLLSIVFSFIGFLALMSSIWYINMYGNVGFSAILFTLTTNNGGMATDILYSFILKSLLPSLLFTALTSFLVWGRTKKKIVIRDIRKNKTIRFFPFSNKLSGFLSVVLVFSLITSSVFMVDFPSWLISITDKTLIYDDYYVDPATVEIKFPESKRNLIYIFLESMETSFFSHDLGGALDYNVIPELYDLAARNTNFSHNTDIGGWPVVTNATWTIASLVSQTSGVPLSIPLQRNTYGKNSAFLPGITNLQDILNANGYYQTVMFGSDGNFAGRDQYYYQHNTDVVYDLFSARRAGIVPNDYHVWWGMEDMYLFEYAKRELPKIAAKDQPFSFTMLTVDTHHVNGYYCGLCQNRYSEQYENVYSCSSQQVYDFVDWLQQQDFYENTTIIICGDHASMDAAYFERNVAPDYDRHIYNCILNAPVNTENNSNRVFTPMDMFPTTLAALGCDIQGDRLGLGTNLYSDLPTIAEQQSLEWLNSELEKSSDYYINNFVVDKKTKVKNMEE